MIEDERVVAEEPDFPPRGAEHGPCDLSRVTLHMVGHAHIDLGYRWDQAETIHRIAPWTFRGVLDLMDRTPGSTFCQSQLFLYEAMRREYPDIFSRIQAAIDAGRWEVVGGSWCEYDAILPSGESVIRQYLQGVHYAEDVLGAGEHRVVFVPDSFCGHAGTLPQILAGCGFQYYVFGRGLPQDEDHPEQTRRAFRWIGPDGSSIIAYLPFGPYSTPPLTPDQLTRYRPYVAAAVSDQELVLHGQGDHGGGPRQAEVDALEALSDIPEAPAWRYSTVHELCDAAFDDQAIQDLGDYRGNLGGFATGSLTSQAQVKRRNRLLEKDLLSAEATAAIGSMLSRKPAFPRVEVQALWRSLLTEQFHDILPGTSVASVYRDSLVAYDRVADGANQLIRDGFARLRSRLDTRGEGHWLVAYNPGLQPVTTPLTVDCPSPVIEAGDPEAWKLIDADGVEVPSHLADDRLSFVASLPSLGHVALRLVPGRPTPPSSPVAELVDGVVRTPHFHLGFDLATGDLSSVRDVEAGSELLAGPGNVLELYEEMGMATSWVHAFNGSRTQLTLVEPPRVVEATPLLTRIATTSCSRWSRFTREITAYADSTRVDFRTQMEWREGNSFLKIGFSPDLNDPSVRASLAHGTVAVDTRQREFCVHDFVDLNDGERGIAFFNDGAYGCSVADGHLGISVIRTVRDMDPDMAHGIHELRYSLFPYSGPARESSLLSASASFHQRALCAFEPDHPGGIKSWGGFDNSEALPSRHSFVSVDPVSCPTNAVHLSDKTLDHVVLCAFKMPEEDWLPLTFVVRLRETDGLEADCAVSLPVEVTSATEADHLERPCDVPLPCQGRQVRVELQPFEIKTILVRL